MFFSDPIARVVEEERLTVEAQLNAGVMHGKIEICDAWVTLSCVFDYGTNGVAEQCANSRRPST